MSLHSVRATAFPMVIRFYRSGREVHRIDVPGPGFVAVPGLDEFDGEGPVDVEITFADGTVMYQPGPRR